MHAVLSLIAWHLEVSPSILKPCVPLQTVANGRSGWSRSRAASLGEAVTLTAKRRVLTPAQVADLTGVSRSTISRKIAAGELRAVKIGNRNQIPYEEFERFWQATMGDVIEISRGEIRTDLFGD